MASRRRKSRKIRTRALNVGQSRLGNQLERGRPLSEAEEKARTLVAKMEKRLRKLVYRNAKGGPSRDRGST